jgi:hypothetical protein
MDFLQNVRNNIGFWLLAKNVKKLKRERAFNNLTTASSVGIFFDTSDNENVVAVISFAEELTKQGITVNLLGKVINANVLKYFPKRDDLELFSRADVTAFSGYPKAEVVNAFMSKDFDILINLSIDKDDLCDNYIIGMSKAKLKVSAKLKSDDYADFILQLSPEKLRNTQKFIEYIKEYLSAFSKA